MGERDDTPEDLAARVEALETRVARLWEQQRRRRPWRERFRPDLFEHERYPPRALAWPGAYRAARPPDPAPAIALVTPSLNQARFLEATLRSVLDQGYPALRYAVQDGGSGDGSAGILARYADRAEVEAAPDDGQSNAVNRGFARVRGEIMGWLNSDDLLAPGALAYVAAYFAARPAVDLVYGHRVVIDAAGEEVGRWILPAHDPAALRWVDFVPQETLFWRARVWDALGGIDPGFRYAMDWDFLLRAQAAGFRCVRLPRFLGCFRVHRGQKTSRERALGDREMAILRRRELGRDVSDREVRAAIRPFLWRHVLTVRAYKLRLVAF